LNTKISSFIKGKGKKGSMRYAELDLARGLAVFFMITYHMFYDLNYFGISSLNPNSGLLLYFGRFTAILFLLIAGISLTISASREDRSSNRWKFIEKFLKRGILILFCAGIVSLGTWIYLGTDGMVIFGILHLIGFSILLAPIYVRGKIVNLFFGLFILIVSPIVHNLNGPLYLLPLGIMPDNYYSVDYTPFIPWFAFILIGTSLGDVLYPSGEPCAYIQKLKLNLNPVLTFPGRHSLIIYLLHQPVLLILIALITGVTVAPG